MKNLKIVIITGLSGSGKSTAMAAFEDAQFYCVDNMPVALLPDFLNLSAEPRSDVAGYAFVMDLREAGFLARYADIFAGLREKGHVLEILFLEAEENTLLKRYSQTRRHHPLARDGGVLEGIRREQQLLGELRAAADHVIDTTHYTVHELKSIIFDIARQRKKRVPMRISILSFGFKYGMPNDADLVMDVRFIDNPYFVPELKPLDGRTTEIQSYVLDRDNTRKFLDKYLDLLDFLIPLYEKEGKAYLTVAVGCTGGRHRSVAISSAIFKHINRPERWVRIRHRDIDKG